MAWEHKHISECLRMYVHRGGKIWWARQNKEWRSFLLNLHIHVVTYRLDLMRKFIMRNWRMWRKGGWIDGTGRFFFIRKGWYIIIRKQATEFHGKEKKEVGKNL